MYQPTVLLAAQLYNSQDPVHFSFVMFSFIFSTADCYTSSWSLQTHLFILLLLSSFYCVLKSRLFFLFIKLQLWCSISSGFPGAHCNTTQLTEMHLLRLAFFLFVTSSDYISGCFPSTIWNPALQYCIIASLSHSPSCLSWTSSPLPTATVCSSLFH